MPGHLINHSKDNDCPSASQAIPGGHWHVTAHLLSLPQTCLKRSKGQELCPETVRLLVQLSILRASFYEEPQFLPLPLRGPSQHGPLRTLSVSEPLRVHRASDLYFSYDVSVGTAWAQLPQELCHTGGPLPMSLELQESWPPSNTAPHRHQPPPLVHTYHA